MAVKTIYKLNNLDFSPGIKAEYINENFDLIRRWLDAERLRAGGWGIVEGFDLSCDIEKFTIKCSQGIIINEHGEEVRVDEKEFVIGPPVAKEIPEKEYKVNEESIIELEYSIYSDIFHHMINYDPPKNNDLDLSELVIKNKDNGNIINKSDIIQVYDNKVVLRKEFANADVTVKHLSSDDRTDAIFLYKDGTEYKLLTGISSSNPSQQEIEEQLKNGYYLIGFAYWHIGDVIDVEFITIDRTLRPIYVNDNNVLYLNGEVYNGNNSIVFVEPKPAKENDLWYDLEHDILYIWRTDEDYNGKWKVVNDLSRFSTEYGKFSVDMMPEDMQTFDFGDRLKNCRFEPGKNQLRIIIDQTVIMQDQYEELVNKDEKNGVNTGYGFKLKYPLDYPSTVEVYVNHSVSTQDNADLFQRIAAFIDSACYDLIEDLEQPVFETYGEYEIGHSQLEVWHNGIRIEKNKGFVELTQGENVADIENAGELTNKFKLLISTKSGDVISYKITRHMSSYDNFMHVVDEINNRMENSLKKIEEITETLGEVTEDTNKLVDTIQLDLSNTISKVNELDEDVIKKSEKVSVENLSNDLKSKLFERAIYATVNITDNSGIFTVNNLKSSDFITIHWKYDNQRNILMRNVDYEISDTEVGIEIQLDPSWAMSDSVIYIEAISLGK